MVFLFSVYFQLLGRQRLSFFLEGEGGGALTPKATVVPGQMFWIFFRRR